MGENPSNGTALDLGLNMTYVKGCSEPNRNVKASLEKIQPSNVNAGQNKTQHYLKEYNEIQHPRRKI